MTQQTMKQLEQNVKLAKLIDTNKLDLSKHKALLTKSIFDLIEGQKVTLNILKGHLRDLIDAKGISSSTRTNYQTYMILHSLDNTIPFRLIGMIRKQNIKVVDTDRILSLHRGLFKVNNRYTYGDFIAYIEQEDMELWKKIIKDKNYWKAKAQRETKRADRAEKLVKELESKLEEYTT